jgi:hypothetical protein
MQPATPLSFRPMGTRVDLQRVVFDVAVRLLRGEEMSFVDEHGRTWQASADRLEVSIGGVLGPVLDGVTAYEVAFEIVRRDRRL